MKKSKHTTQATESTEATKTTPKLTPNAITAIIELAVAPFAWIDPTDAIHELRTRIVDDHGTPKFRSETTNADGEPQLVEAKDIATEIATRKPHWVKKTEGTSAAGDKKSTTNLETYDTIMKDDMKLRDYVKNKPEELAKLRSAHFGTL